MGESLPQCVGFIMDGNRRWAKTRGLPTLEGHRQGYESLKRLIRTVHRVGVPHMICYAFSTENWNRSEAEVTYLMNLMSSALTELTRELIAEGKRINLKVVGEINRLPRALQEQIIKAESGNTDTPELTLWIGISYGGRAEILSAVNKAIVSGEQVTEETFSRFLWTEGMPDPDLIIRTSGELRLSNFLLWQSAYSELFFTDTFWPDFGEEEFQSILEQYATRQRRRGT